jgi:large subunit ribosomal protein L17
MRHLVAGRKLGRTSAHRRALLRNLAQSLVEHEQVRTTLPKAKELRRFVEKLITLARKAHEGDLAARQLLIKKLCDRGIIAEEHRESYDLMSDAKRGKVLRSRSGRRHRSGQPRPGLSFTAESVVHRLINTIAPRYADRPGGYTRIIKLATLRVGDGGEQAIVQLVGSEQAQGRAASRQQAARDALKPSRPTSKSAEAPAGREEGSGEPAEAPEVPPSESSSDQPDAGKQAPES